MDFPAYQQHFRCAQLCEDELGEGRRDTAGRYSADVLQNINRFQFLISASHRTFVSQLIKAVLKEEDNTSSAL